MITWFLYIIAEALIQAHYIKEGNRPNYLQLFIIRGMASIFHGVIVNVQPYPWYDYPLLVLWQASSFWIFFDLILNELRGKPLDYKGENSGWLDSLPEFWYWIGKCLSLLMFIVLSCYYFFK